MGHFFVYNGSTEVMGVNHGGSLLVVRRDKTEPAVQLIRKAIQRAGPRIEGIQEALQPFRELMYPSEYISALEGATKYKEFYEIEKRTYAVFKDEFYESYVNFRASEVKKRIDADLVEAILAIFLHDSDKLTYEFQLSGKVLRIAEKPSVVSRLFSNTKSGDTLHSCLVHEISEIEVSQDKVRFFNGHYDGDDEYENSNFMTLTRDRCYANS